MHLPFQTSLAIVLSLASLRATASPVGETAYASEGSLVLSEASTNAGDSDTQLAQFVNRLQEYNLNHSVAVGDDLVTARSNIPILDFILEALRDSEISNVIIDSVLLNPELLDLTTEATSFILRAGLVNLKDLIVAIQKSGLVSQLLELGLNDLSILPGLFRITRELLKEANITFPGARSSDANAADNTDSDETVHDDVQVDETSQEAQEEPPHEAQEEVAYLLKRDSALLNELVAALKESGLIVSITQHILTTPELAAPNARFLLGIIRSGALSLKQIFDSLKESGVLLDLLREVLNKSRTLLARFGKRLFDLVKHDGIDKDVFHDLPFMNATAAAHHII